MKKTLTIREPRKVLYRKYQHLSNPIMSSILASNNQKKMERLVKVLCNYDLDEVNIVGQLHDSITISVGK